jgi:hypothetical protein
VQPLKVRVRLEGKSSVLLNATDPQGPKQAKRLTARGGELSRDVTPAAGGAADGTAAAGGADVDGGGRPRALQPAGGSAVENRGTDE